MIAKIIITTLLVIACSWLCFASRTVSPLITGQAAIGQLQDTNDGWINTNIANQLANNEGWVVLAFVVFITLLWFKEIKTCLSRSLVANKMGLFLLLMSLTTSAFARYDNHDNEEYVTIKTNQTAFYIPQQGKTKEGQGFFDSEAFLNEAKVAEKRIKIPHQSLSSWGIGQTMYIPSAVVYVVTREPFVRQWTKESTRGTNTGDQAIYLESKESINIDFGVSIGAHIDIKDAAKYLFYMGTDQTINQGDDSNFPSEVYAKPLATVMDSVVHQRVQTLLATEFGKLNLDECIMQKAAIMERVQKQVIDDYAKDGITVEYVGFATGLNFDKAIQQSIDDIYVARNAAMASENQLLAIQAKKALAEVDIVKAEATAISKWDGHVTMPSFLLVSDQLAKTLGSWFQPAATPEPLATPPAKR